MYPASVAQCLCILILSQLDNYFCSQSIKAGNINCATEAKPFLPDTYAAYYAFAVTISQSKCQSYASASPKGNWLSKEARPVALLCSFPLEKHQHFPIVRRFLHKVFIMKTVNSGGQALLLNLEREFFPRRQGFRFPFV